MKAACVVALQAVNEGQDACGVNLQAVDEGRLWCELAVQAVDEGRLRFPRLKYTQCNRAGRE
jgi:hypothetical protein